MAGQVPEGFTLLKEGKAGILQHTGGNDVFYNKAQVVNRDISIVMLHVLSEKIQEEVAGGLFPSPKPAKRERPRTTSGEAEASGSAQPNGENGALPDAALNGDGGGVGGSEEEAGGAEGLVSGSGGAAVEGAVGTASVALTTAEAGPGSSSQQGGSGPKQLRILEALAASGLRALRYALEVPAVSSVVAADCDRAAVGACRRNILYNGPLGAKVSAVETDSRVYMLTHPKQFEVVDLDPYGAPSVFLDSAVQAVADGGMLMCTATDMAVLCGNNAEVGWSKYGSYPLRSKACHEMALRILLHCIENHANRYKRHIVPVLSLSVDFYIRVFVRVYTSANAIKSTPSRLAYVYQCIGCETFHTQAVGRVTEKNKNQRFMPELAPAVGKSCEHCGKSFSMGGPIWAAPIHDPAWLRSALQHTAAHRGDYPAHDKIRGLLTAASEELLDVPLFVSVHGLSATLKCTPPAATLFRSAILNAGYRVSGSHTNPLGLKTDAPPEVVWDIMRCWVQDHPVKQSAEETVGSRILVTKPTLKANFTRVMGAISKAQREKVPRFVPNPEQYWGPRPRAGRKLTMKQAASMGLEAHAEGGDKKRQKTGDDS